MNARESSGTFVAARCVGIRELARAAGTLLNEIETDGKAFAVSRNGRITALLVPLPDRVILEFHDVASSPRMEELHVEDEQGIDLEALNLDDLQREIVKDAATVPFWSPEDRPEFTRDVNALSISLVRLELKGLMERGRGGGRRATQMGRRVAELLR